MLRHIVRKTLTDVSDMLAASIIKTMMEAASGPPSQMIVIFIIAAIIT
jgi:hypothetical protein